MLTYVLMGFLLLGIGFSSLWGIKYEPDKGSFMSIMDTTFLRGFWCIIVVLVHVPATYQNKIQDMLGSFAYIGVSFFFMTSAYGLKWSLAHKKGYMDHFWRRRLPPILIPALIANAVGVLVKSLSGSALSVLAFVNIHDWVKVLLLFYFFFWIVYGFIPKLFTEGKWQDIAICLIVLLCSIIDRMTSIKLTSIWVVEPLGFAYGIMAAKWSAEIERWLQRNWVTKLILSMITSAIIGVIYLKFKHFPFWGDYLLKGLLGLATLWFMFEVIERWKVSNPVNRFLAGISYEVFILHFSVFALMSAVVAEGFNSGLYIVLSIIITVLFAYVLNRLCRLETNYLSKFGG